MDRGSHLLESEQKPAVPGDGNHGFVRMRDLDTERCVITEAKIVLVSTSNVLPRSVDGKTKSRGKAHLAHFLDEKAVARQHGANSLEIAHLRLHLREGALRLGLDLEEFAVARRR